MTNIYELLSKGLNSPPAPAVGYSEQEIECIERVYGIKILGQLREFMYAMGRSDGGIIGDFFIPSYRSTWGIRSNMRLQFDFFRHMQDSKKFEYLNGSYVFAIYGENNFCFVQTGEIDPDIVYKFDLDNDVVYDDGVDLFGCLKMLADENDGIVQKNSIGNMLGLF